jgi:hypothetical protein
MWVATTKGAPGFCRTMGMADTATTLGSLGAPVSQLKSLTDQLVTVTTDHGDVTGTVLSCTRQSVWLVAGDDADVVVALDEITRLVHHPAPAAA